MENLTALASALTIKSAPTTRTSFFSLPQELRDLIYAFAVTSQDIQELDLNEPMPKMNSSEARKEELIAAYYSCNTFFVTTFRGGIPWRGPRQKRWFRNLRQVQVRVLCIDGFCRYHRKAWFNGWVEAQVSLCKGEVSVQNVELRDRSWYLGPCSKSEQYSTDMIAAGIRDFVERDKDRRYSGLGVLKLAANLMTDAYSLNGTFFDLRAGAMRWTDSEWLALPDSHRFRTATVSFSSYEVLTGLDFC